MQQQFFPPAATPIRGLCGNTYVPIFPPSLNASERENVRCRRTPKTPSPAPFPLSKILLLGIILVNIFSSRAWPLPSSDGHRRRGVIEMHHCCARHGCALSYVAVPQALLPGITRLQRMRVIRRLDDLAALLLLTDETILHPRILQNLIHVRPLLGVEFQHPTDDMAGLAW